VEGILKGIKPSHLSQDLCHREGKDYQDDEQDYTTGIYLTKVADIFCQFISPPSASLDRIKKTPSLSMNGIDISVRTIDSPER
jgi:hypothetical protein